MRNDEILDNFDFREPEFNWDETEAEIAGKYYSLLEAEFAASRLRSENIPCFLANTGSAAVLPHVQAVIRLHVRAEDSERAREILAEAAIESDLPEEKSSGNSCITFLAVLVGLMLAWFFVKAISGNF